MNDFKNEPDFEIGDALDLKKRRLALGLTQVKLGRIFGISSTYISRIELGKAKPKQYMFMALDTLESRMVCSTCKRLLD